MENLQRCCQPLHYPVNEAGSSLQNRGSKCNKIDWGDIEVSEIRKRGEVADYDDFTSRRASMKNMDDWSKSCGVKNLWHLRFNIFIQRRNCGQSGFYRFTTPTHREMKTTQREWYHMKSWIRWRILGGSSKGASEEDFKRIVNFRSDFMKPPRGSVKISAMARSWRYALTNQVQWYSDPMRGGPSQHQLV